MPRIKLIIQYKGTHYHGWQIQPNGVTVQEILQKALSKILNQKMTVIGASRTDSGVHALGQVCHFDISSEKDSLSLWGEGGGEGESRLQRGLNSLLPPDISVISAEPVSPTFHAQKSAKKKIYEYRIHNSPVRSPFLHEYSWQIPYPLNLKKMRQAAKVLVGEHDFSAFCASGSSVKTTVRKVYRVVIKTTTVPPNVIPAVSEGLERESRFGSLESEMDPRYKLVGGAGMTAQRCISILVEGNGFLKQMVRNIVGTLTDVGRGKIPPSQVKKILNSRDRKQAGPTAPAKGLILKSVIY